MAINKDQLFLFGGASSECEKYVCGDFWVYNVSGPYSCPKDCSGHGVCEWGFCMCDRGFKGDDCSAMNCPEAVCSFTYADHWQDCVECSGQGECTGNGTCICGSGWKGEACEVLACPGGFTHLLYAVSLHLFGPTTDHNKICRRLLRTWHVQDGGDL